MRGDWREVGTYDRETMTYHVERIPAPPKARTVLERNEFAYEVAAGLELKQACPKCLEPIITRWQKTYSESALEGYRDPYGNPEIMAMLVARDAVARATQAERERDAAYRREAEARSKAESAEASFRRIQLTKSKRAARKRRRRGR